MSFPGAIVPVATPHALEAPDRRRSRQGKWIQKAQPAPPAYRLEDNWLFFCGTARERRSQCRAIRPANPPNQAAESDAECQRKVDCCKQSRRLGKASHASSSCPLRRESHAVVAETHGWSECSARAARPDEDWYLLRRFKLGVFEIRICLTARLRPQHQARLINIVVNAKHGTPESTESEGALKSCYSIVTSDGADAAGSDVAEGPAPIQQWAEGRRHGPQARQVEVRATECGSADATEHRIVPSGTGLR
ncbi:hypothetical protein SLS57_012018 [Botryosphaeria dothidea]